MSVNGISGYSQLDAYSAYSKNAPAKAEKAESAAKENEEGVVLEVSSEAKKAAKTYTQNMDFVKQLQADAEEQKNRLLSYVQEAISGQGVAIGSADDVWKMLAKGKVTVSQAAREEAQAAISKGGYWSVDKTAERILDFAKALTGGDPSKIESMRSAFEKGFKEATKTWGQDLPEISQKTYEAVEAGFDAWLNEN